MNTLLGDGHEFTIVQNIRERYWLCILGLFLLNMLRDTGSFGVYLGTDKKHIQRALDLVLLNYMR